MGDHLYRKVEIFRSLNCLQSLNPWLDWLWSIFFYIDIFSFEDNNGGEVHGGGRLGGGGRQELVRGGRGR